LDQVMNRRETTLALLVLGATASPAFAAPGSKVHRIALLPDFSVDFDPDALKAFLEALSAAGRIEGRDFVLYRSGIGYGRDFELAVRRVVEAEPDLIFGFNTGYIRAAQRALPRTPIVMWASGFPVEAGVVDSLARPGRNVTGMSGFAGTGLFAKYLELLHDAKPSIKRIGYFWSYLPPFNPREEMERSYAEMRAAAHQIGVEVRVLEIADPNQVDAALAVASRDNLEALVLTTGASLFPVRQKIIDFAIRRHLLTLTDYRWTSVDPAPIFSYGPSDRSLITQAAGYVDRILWGGAKPGDLPVQQPTKFELLVNLKTARALGIGLPQALLLRADEVIQ
jgi:putative tryptophan/tyrosine transport system substrate-binding protein